jgi:signal transduction histidine kinase
MLPEQDESVLAKISHPLDALAYAGWTALHADRVVIAIADPAAQRAHRPGGPAVAVVHGTYGGTGRSIKGRRLLLAAGIPAGAVTVVACHDEADGSIQVGPLSVRAGAGEEPCDGSTLVLRGATAGQAEMVVLVQAPRDIRTAETIGSLHQLVHAAAAAGPAAPHVVAAALRSGLQEREEERRRWARELHDETLQQMGALQVLLTSTLRNAQSPTGPAQMPDALRTAVRLLNDQIVGLRHLITELRPATLDELGLSAPLQALARRTEELTGLSVEVHVSLRFADGQLTTRLLPDVEVAIYRVVQEALTNASRHSGATRARISVVEDDDQVVVQISDNGTGMSRSLTAPGFGITGMHERAVLAGGQLQVLPGAGHGEGGEGTVIRLVVPAAHRVGPEDGSVAEAPGSGSAHAPHT